MCQITLGAVGNHLSPAGQDEPYSLVGAVSTPQFSEPAGQQQDDDQEQDNPADSDVHQLTPSLPSFNGHNLRI